MFKFRSATNFEALALPGTSARLFDVKKAIVKAKKLDRVTNQLEFDLSVKNASTKEEYTDDTMLLPRGTRVIVQRLPAAKGHGLLSRIARDDYNGNNHVAYGNKTAAKNGFYEFTSREEDEEDEFEDAAADEMAALKAVTDQAMYNTTSTSRQTAKPWTSTASTSATVPPRGPPSNNNFHTHNHKTRPNADPELAKQERLLQQQQQPKKRPTGIPRTFLNSTSSSTTAENNDATKEEESALSRLQPIGFQALMGGKNSNNFNPNNTHDLEYALKVTSTIIPDHLQCAICKSVAKQAMLLPWDLEGRTTCESCIRDSLTQNGFVCPLTHQMGVSPDELLPNHGLRKAAELFIAQVREDMDTVIQQQQKEQEEQEQKIKKESEDNVLEEETSSILTKKSNKKLKQEEEVGIENDPFGEDEFGGDVFDVVEEEKPPVEEVKEVEDTKVEIPNIIVKEEPTIDDAPANIPKSKDEEAEVKNTNETVPQKISNFNNNNNNKFDSFPKQQQQQQKQSRGPPQGYMIGPATTHNENSNEHNSRRGGAYSRGGGRNYMGHRAGRGAGSNRNRGGGRGYNNDNSNNRFTSESQQSKNHQHHRPSVRTYSNSQQQHQQDQWDGQKHRSINGNDKKNHSVVDNVNKKRTHEESFDADNSKDDRPHQRHFNPRNNHRGSNNHGQDSYTRGDSYRRQPNNNHANSFNQRGSRGNGQDRFRNHNFRGRGRNYGGYRDGNDYSRGRY